MNWRSSFHVRKEALLIIKESLSSKILHKIFGLVWSIWSGKSNGKFSYILYPLHHWQVVGNIFRLEIKIAIKDNIVLYHLLLRANRSLGEKNIFRFSVRCRDKITFRYWHENARYDPIQNNTRRPKNSAWQIWCSDKARLFIYKRCLPLIFTFWFFGEVKHST